MNDFLDPTLPLEDGDRVVGIRNWDRAEADPALRSLRDFAVWREDLASVEDLGAFRTLERNLIIGEEAGEPVEVAEISGSAFRLARVRPLLGRSLIEADEQAGAPAVVVIGHDVWQTRFRGDPGVVGRTLLRLDGPRHGAVRRHDARSASDRAPSRLVAVGAPRARRMEEQERVTGEVLERDRHDVPSAREPRMSVSLAA